MFKILLIVLTGCCYSNDLAAQDASRLIYQVDGKESAYPRLSKDGQRILYQSNQNGHWQLYITNLKSGQETQLLKDTFNDNFPDWSWDNQWIAFVSDRDGNEEIYIMKTDGSQVKRITNDPGRDIHPYFSPDGRYLIFNSTRQNGAFDIFRYTIASGALFPLSHTYEDETCARYAPDMTHIVYLQNGATTDDIMLADSLNAKPINLTTTPYIQDGWPVFSYDGRWIYYSSMESGQYCIYRIKPDGTSKTQITTAQAGEEDARASLSRDGHLLIYNKRIGATIQIRSLNLI